MNGSGPEDVVIIGGGPAGLSAAAWCCDLGLSAVLIEREAELGGQLHMIHGSIDNYLGVEAANGVELLERFRRSIERFSFVRNVGSGVTAIDLSSNTIRLGDHQEIIYRCLIIATGVRPRRLDVPGETEFQGAGVLESGVRDRHLVAGRNVVIVGGGDAAIENALILSQSAESVTVVHRRDRFKARDEFLGQMDDRKNIKVELETTVARIVGDAKVSGVELENVASGVRRHLASDAVLVRIGVEPNSDLFRGLVNMDDRGYIRVGDNGETSVTGVFAAGDVANPVAPTISTATGTGAKAAKAAYQLMKAGDNKV